MDTPSSRRKQAEGNVHFRTHSTQSIAHAQDLRTHATIPERRLWGKLGREQTGHRFRRQHPIGSYIVDFACIKQRLIIELDGGQHNAPEAIAYDMARTATFEQLGYRVLRFWNHEVIENLEGVYSTIMAALEDAMRHSDPHPSSP